jgi:hypothetical protein
MTYDTFAADERTTRRGDVVPDRVPDPRRHAQQAVRRRRTDGRPNLIEPRELTLARSWNAF